MPTSVTRDIAAPRTRVWEVMADGWTYSQWVVGNSRMRRSIPTGRQWAPGSCTRSEYGPL